MTFDAVTYFRTAATKLLDIEHSEEEQHFFRIRSLAGMDELLNTLGTASFPALLVHDTIDGAIGDFANTDSFMDEPQIIFYVLNKADITDQSSVDTAIRGAHAIGNKIIAMMLKHKHQDKHGLQFLDVGNIPYQSVGPIGDYCYGMMYIISVTEHIELIVDTDDWDGSW